MVQLLENKKSCLLCAFFSHHNNDLLWDMWSIELKTIIDSFVKGFEYTDMYPLNKE